jgi:hypothetical protein
MNNFVVLTSSSLLLCSQRNLGMEVIGEEEVNETDRSEDGGATPTRFGIDSSSQSATSHVPPAGPSRGRHGSSSVPRAGLPRPSRGVQRVRRSPAFPGVPVGATGEAFPVLPVGTACEAFVDMHAAGAAPDRFLLPQVLRAYAQVGAHRRARYSRQGRGSPRGGSLRWQRGRFHVRGL